MGDPTFQIVVEIDEEALGDTVLDDAARARALEESAAIVSQRLEGTGVWLHAWRPTRGDGLAFDLSGPVDAPEIFFSAIGTRGELDFRMVDDQALPTNTMAGIANPGSMIVPYAQGAQYQGEFEAVKRIGGIDGRHILDARAGIDPMTNEPVINIALDDEGGVKLARLSTANVGQRMAIVLDVANQKVLETT